MTNKEAVEIIKKNSIEPDRADWMCYEASKELYEANMYAISVLEGINKYSLQDIIYKAIYKDRKPKQEIGARLECLGLAQAITKYLLEGEE